MGDDADRKQFLTQVRKGCRIARTLRELGIRPVRRRADRLGLLADRMGRRIPKANTQRIAETFREACDIAEEFGERLAAEGEICWGGMHSWRRMVELLEAGRPPEDARLPGRHGPHAAVHAGLQRAGRRLAAGRISTGTTRAAFDAAYKQLTDALRPWTIDFHVAQNDATVNGSGSHDKTGRHCLPNDPNGKLDIVKYAGYWLRDEQRQPDQTLPAHLLGRLHVPQRNADEARRPGTTSWRRWSPCAMRTAGMNKNQINHGGHGDTEKNDLSLKFVSLSLAISEMTNFK